MDYEYLRPYCDTDKQRLCLDVLLVSDTNKDAADELQITERNLYEMLRRLKKRAAKQGCAPTHDMNKTVPEGYRVAGVSTLYGDDGEIKAQWVKSKNISDDDIQEEILEAFLGRLPKEKAVARGKQSKNEDLLNLHILTDYHLGMYAWGEEAGDDWDIKIAEDLLVKWFQYSISTAPKAAIGVLSQMGDLIHIDGFESVTPTSKHLLDSDGRFQKIIRVAIRALRRIIRMMLKKYDSVHIIMADANHDPASSAWMREVFHAFYDEEPRVTVDRSPSTYYCYEHGETSLFFHHGHRRKPNNIDDVFTAKFRDVFGRTKQSYAHLGHLHHKEAKETNLMIVEQHRTMAANDAYASQGGWLTGRGAPVITYHKKFGDVGRFEVDPRMLE
jgi:hypothetical protein